MVKTDLEQIEFAQNPEPRCAVILLLDTSQSMQGQPIDELNEGLRELDKALKIDKLASLRVELAVVAFGGTVRAIDVKGNGQREVPFSAEEAFITADAFQAPRLEVDGDTPMGEAVRRSLSLLRERKEIYKRNGVDYFRSWIFLITDGKPTDTDWEAAAKQVSTEEQQKGVLFYAIGVRGADMNTLAQFSTQRQPLQLKGLAFRELFQWLSKSLSAVAQSRPGDMVPLPPVGWAQTDTSH